MEVLNIHKRTIYASKAKVVDLFSTLASKNDKVWPSENWPRMKLTEGLQKGSKGGHGPIRYQVIEYKSADCIVFKFQKPKGFNGVHKFEISELDTNKIEVKHTIRMTTSGSGTVKWLLAIRSLHDALVEDALDKIQNHLSKEKRTTKWSFWVKVLRGAIKS